MPLRPKQRMFMLGASHCGSGGRLPSLLRPFAVVVAALAVLAVAVAGSTAASRFYAARVAVERLGGAATRCRVVEVERIPDAFPLFSVRLVAEDGVRGWSIDASPSWASVGVGDLVACVKTVDGGVAPAVALARARRERAGAGAELALMVVTGIFVVCSLLAGVVAEEAQRRLGSGHQPVELARSRTCGVVDKGVVGNVDTI